MQSLPKPLIQTLLRGAALLLLIVSRSSLSADFRPIFDSSAIDEFARTELQHQQVPGIGLGIFWQGEVLYAKGYGYANVEHSVPVSSSTLFQTASVGKQFTAAAVMLLVDEGKLALDAPITAYFAEAPATWSAITVRRLLTHTSGLQDYFDGLLNRGVAPFDSQREYTEEELLRAFYELPIEFTPGARYQYCNTGYVLLGILLHRVSGQFYGDFLQARVFGPLQMKTARVISEADIVRNRAAGYRLVDGELKNQEWYAPSVNTTADGALYLSILDYAAWEKALRAKALLTASSWMQILSPVVLNSGKTYPYGFGWIVEEAKGRPWYHHSGSSQGFKTYISRYLADDLTIVVLSNSIDSHPDRFVDGIASILDPRLPKIRPVSPVVGADAAETQWVTQWLVGLAQGEVPSRETLGSRRVLREQLVDYGKQLRSLGSIQRVELISNLPAGDERAYIYRANYQAGVVRVEFVRAADGRIMDFSVEPE
jgi:CubicO group peptidase (beta-lactamase class C family)